jgi:hypothetical protein
VSEDGGHPSPSADRKPEVGVEPTTCGLRNGALPMRAIRAGDARRPTHELSVPELRHRNPTARGVDAEASSPTE